MPMVNTLHTTRVSRVDIFSTRFASSASARGRLRWVLVCRVIISCLIDKQPWLAKHWLFILFIINNTKVCNLIRILYLLLFYMENNIKLYLLYFCANLHKVLQITISCFNFKRLMTTGTVHDKTLISLKTDPGHQEKRVKSP